MTVLSGQTIRSLCVGPLIELAGSTPMLWPFSERTQHEESGTSFGLSMCGYDIRLDQDIKLWSGWMSENGYHTDTEPVLRGGGQRKQSFSLASTMERFCMPADVVGIVHDKSTWARHGITVQNTVIEPGWAGFLTLELAFHGQGVIELPKGTPIAQVLFHRVDMPTAGYDGKYQNQERGPQGAR